MNTLKLKTLGLLTFAAASLSACGEGLPLETPETSQASVEQAAFELPDSFKEWIRYQNYLSQAGFQNSSELRTTKEIVACDLNVFQGEVTFNGGVTRDCVYQATEFGWGIESVRVEVLNNRNNRGTYSYNTLAENGQFNFNIEEIGAKWNAAIELAAGAGDNAVKGKLQVDYQAHMQRVLSLSANKNTVHLSVTANGGFFERSEIHVKLYATLVRLQ